MPETITRYGWQFPAELCDLEIEFQAIRYGGWWRLNKQSPTCGNGLYWHYKRAHELLWPEDDFHRWAELILKTFLDESITVIQGGKDSSKSRSAAKFALVDFWTYPDDTLIFISSTEMRGADYRIWGDIKSLCIRALERYEWLPGKVLEAKHAICTDDLEEIGIRDPRKGVIFIPCFGSGGAWVGLQRYCGIKQKRRRLIGDECFPAGTPVDTPNGPKPIESIQSGDMVINSNGIDRVIGVGYQEVESLYRVRSTDGREILCTPNHEFLTQIGWVKACNLLPLHYMVAPYEAMQGVPNTIPSLREATLLRSLQNKASILPYVRRCFHSQDTIGNDALLQHVMQEQVDDDTTGLQEEGLYQGAWKENQHRKIQDAQGPSRNSRSNETAHDSAQSDKKARSVGEDNGPSDYEESRTESAYVSHHEREEMGMAGALQVVKRSNCSRVEIDGDVSRRTMELCGLHESKKGQRLSLPLQDRLGFSRHKTSSRSRWSFSPIETRRTERPKEELHTRGSWVESSEILKPDDFERAGACEGRITVYNLHIEKEHNYSVNGLCVSNCQFMKAEYVDVLTNLNSGDFKGIFLGNPIGQNDPLDKLGEPVGGWGSEGVIKKTTTWKNKFGGTTICLYGPDSPNFDYPQEHGVKRYPYLIGQKDIDWVKNSYGDDSHTFWMQVMGVRRAGLTARRVITRATCEQHGALDACVWSGGNTTMIAGLDAAYGGVGGDRCVLQIVEFGPGITNAPKPNSKEVAIPFPGQGTQTNTLLKCYPPVIVPVSVSNSGTPEDQIATFCKNHCESMGVLPENFFFDGRGTVAIALAKIWSPLVNSIEFGGAATKRNVSQDHWTYDVESRQRRLKRCDEEYSKFVTELWFSVRYAIESGQVRELPSETMEEGCQREWKLVTRDRKEVETKSDMKKRTNRSPDLFDGLVICCEGARRRGFQISKMSNAESEQSSQKWIDELYDKSKKLSRSKELVPA